MKEKRMKIEKVISTCQSTNIQTSENDVRKLTKDTADAANNY